MSNGNITLVPLEIANEFNNFFVKVGQDISDSVPTIDKSPESFLDTPEDIQLLASSSWIFITLCQRRPLRKASRPTGSWLLNNIRYCLKR